MPSIDFAAALNPEQLAATIHPEGPLLILAGAGSGKTRVITHRIAFFILNQRIRADRILAVTFTNKATREMQERVDALLGRAASLATFRPSIGTFHATCARILRSHAHHLGLTASFSIYDDADQIAMIRRCAADMLLDDDRSAALTYRAFIDRCKNHGYTPSQAFEHARGRAEEEAADLYERYAQRMLEAGAVDFGDLILLTLRILREHPQVAQRMRKRWTHVLVDEFQDTNPAQYELLRLLCGDTHPNLTVVGDDDQSIYAWRGATVDNILRFEEHFPGTAVVKLERNYRSSNTILDAAADLIQHNAQRKSKRLWTERTDGQPIAIYPATSERDEAAFVTRTIKRLCLDQGIRFDQVAVFYRINALGRIIEEQLRADGIDHRVVGTVAFFERAEIKDVLAFLTLLVNPGDPLALSRVLNLPPRGLGAKSQKAIEAFLRNPPEALAAAHPLERLTAIARHGAGPFNTRVRKGVTDFVDLMDDLHTLSLSVPPSELVELLLERSALLEHLEKRNKDRIEDIRENLNALVTMLADFEDTQGDAVTLADFLEHTALVRSPNRPEPSTSPTGAVHLMSIHSAKGLEFDAVFLIGIEEDILPHTRNEEDVNIEEERRLTYVALTRARHHLYLSHAKQRRLHGSFRQSEPSRFLAELNPAYLYALKGSLDDARGISARTATRRRRRPKPPVDPYEHFEPPPSDDALLIDDLPDYEEAIITYDEGPPEPTSSDAAFVIGDTVTHKRFGVGEVVGVQDRGRDVYVVVDFPMTGRKTVVSRFLRTF